MAELSNLIAEVQAEIRRPGYDSATITSLLNRGVQELCGLLYFPDLITNYSATTHIADISSVTYPSGAEVIITSTAHGVSSGDKVLISGCTRNPSLDSKTFVATRTGANTFTLDGTDGDDYTGDDLGASYDYGNAYLNYITMPSNFYSGVQDRVVSLYSTSRDMNIRHNRDWRYFYQRYNEDLVNGAINEFTVVGSKIYFDYCPAEADSLMITYFRKPTDMSGNTDTPEGLPSHLHQAYCVTWTKWKLMSSYFSNREMAANTAIELWGYPMRPPVLSRAGGVFADLQQFLQPPIIGGSSVRDVSDDPIYWEA